jgi:tRNA threonylcarbamoyl adenosine modification protein YeaZ
MRVETATPQLRWVIDTTGFELLFALNNTTTNQWLFRYETPLSSQRSHSALLVPLFQEACTVAQVPLSAVNQLTMCVGPGSFTGLRAGLATVKTLGQWLPSLEITPITVFERLRLQAKLAGLMTDVSLLTVVLDAKQNRLYTATWQAELGWQDPQFTLLEAWLSSREQDANPTKKHLVILNETLVPILVQATWMTSTVEQLASFAVEALSLADSHPLPWQELEPLYLQNPNITVKKIVIKEIDG